MNNKNRNKKNPKNKNKSKNLKKKILKSVRRVLRRRNNKLLLTSGRNSLVGKPPVWFNPVNNPYRAPKRFLSDKKRKVIEYIHSILDPAIAVESGKLVKQPSLFPVFSTCVSFRNRFTISTEAQGEFYLGWNPNFLVNQDSLPTNKITNLDGTVFNIKGLSHLCQKTTTQGVETLGFWSGYMPTVGMSKYRLVSAKISVSYIGPTIQRSGIMFACATYDPVPLAYTSELDVPCFTETIAGLPIAGSAFTGAKKECYDALNENNIINGLWNKTVNVQRAGKTLSCISIPTDPSSSVFQPMGSYFGEKGSQPNDYQLTGNSLTEVAFSNTIVDTSVEGTQICFLIGGKGLPASTECISVTTYYNFEVIPTTKTAPFMRNSNSSEFSPNEARFVEETLRNIDQSRASIRVDNDVSNFANSVGNLLSNVSMGINSAARTAKIINNAFGKKIEL